MFSTTTTDSDLTDNILHLIDENRYYEWQGYAVSKTATWQHLEGVATVNILSSPVIQ